MARGREKPSAKKSHHTKKDRPGKQGASKFVAKYEFFAKSRLAAYPNEEGTCVYLDKGQDEKGFFALESIAEGRTAQNEELRKRLGMGLALDAASVNNGAKRLQKHWGKSLPDPVPAQLHKTGLPKLLEEFETQNGKEFLHSVSTLDVGKTGRPSEKEVKKATQTFVRYLREDDGSLRRNLARQASESAALYLFSMTLLKDMALIRNPKVWVSKLEGKQSDDVKSWQRKPQDAEKMVAALVKELMTKIDSHQPEAGKRRKASDSSSAAPAASNASSGGASSDAAPSSKDGTDDGSGKSGSPVSSQASTKKSSKSSSPSPPKRTPAKKAKDDKKKDHKSKGDKTDKKDKEAAKKEAKDAKEKKDKDKKDKKEAARKEKKQRDAHAKKQEEAAKAKEAKEAAFTEWTRSDAETLREKAAEAKGNIGLMEGRSKKESIMSIIREVPLNVMPLFPAAQEAAAAIVELDGDWVPNTDAKPLLCMVSDIAEQAADFFASHAEAATGVSGG